MTYGLQKVVKGSCLLSVMEYCSRVSNHLPQSGIDRNETDSERLAEREIYNRATFALDMDE